MTDLSAYITARPARDDWPRRNGRAQIPYGNTTLDCYSPSQLPNYLGAGWAGNASWEARCGLKGAGMRPGIAAMAAPLDVTADRQELAQLWDDAQIAGGRLNKANFGTAMHSAKRRIIRGQTPDVPEELRADCDAITQVLVDWGIQLHDNDSDEMFLINTELPTAGSADDFVTTSKHGGVFTLDLKTGQFKALPCAIQLSAYANSTHTADLIDDVVVLKTLGFAPNPEYGLILHAPLRTGKAEIKIVDLNEGYRLARQAIANHLLTLNQKRLVVEFRDVSKRLPAIEHPVEAVAVGEPGGGSPPAAPRPATVTPITNARTTKTAELTRRLTTLVTDTACTKADVSESWPAAAPTLKQSGHTADTLDRIEGMVLMLEMANGLDSPLMVDVQTIIGRLKALPSDLYDDVNAKAKALTPPIPNVEHGKPTAGDICRLDALVTEGERTAAQRLVTLVDHLSPISDTDAAALVAWATEQRNQELTTADTDSLTTLTHLETERVTALAALHQTGPDDLTAHLIDTCGSRTDAVKAGKRLAERHGLPKPGSTGDIAANRVLAALVIATPGET